MNRHQRRRARRMTRHNKFYQTYVRHLPRIPLDAPLDRGRVYHLVVQHDEWCQFVSRYVEPRRS
jgi:hypothetical protein